MSGMAPDLLTMESELDGVERWVVGADSANPLPRQSTPDRRRVSDNHLLAMVCEIRRLRARIAELESELSAARESNARLNRRAQDAEAKVARVEKIERRIAERNTRKPLPRIEAAYALAAAETRIAELEAELDYDISAMTIRGLRERLDEARARIAELENSLQSEQEESAYYQRVVAEKAARIELLEDTLLDSGTIVPTLRDDPTIKMKLIVRKSGDGNGPR